MVGRLLKDPAAFLVYTGSAAALIAGWIRQEEWVHVPDEGFGYALGIVGGVLLLFQAVYPLRKRITVLKYMGETKYWFMSHMLAGVLGPVIIIFHCNFKLGSLNGRVALLSMLLVAASGLVGRHIYVRIHKGLYGRKKRLKHLKVRWLHLRQRLADLDDGELETMLKSFESPIRASAYRPYQVLKTLFFLHTRARLVSYRGNRHITATVPEMAQPFMRQLMEKRIKAARELAEFHGYERLFALWHVVHLPFFYLMLATGIFHVIAVHMY